jgi:hypothetical protein
LGAGETVVGKREEVEGKLAGWERGSSRTAAGVEDRPKEDGEMAI